jgi:hypothetical protein
MFDGKLIINIPNKSVAYGYSKIFRAYKVKCSRFDKITPGRDVLSALEWQNLSMEKIVEANCGSLLLTQDALTRERVYVI